MNKILCFYFFFILLSCSKKDNERAYVINDGKSLEKLFQLKSYKNQKKNKINDSIMHIKANNGSFFLEGDLDSKLNMKTGIWTLTNNSDSRKIEIDYMIFGKKDGHQNQIIFSDNGKIDSSASKFYTSKIINKNDSQKLILSFFSPQNSRYTFEKATIKYFIGNNKKNILKDSIILQDSKGIYRTKINYNFKKGDEIFGYFSEYTISNEISNDSVKLGNNTMYFHKKFE